MQLQFSLGLSALLIGVSAVAAVSAERQLAGGKILPVVDLQHEDFRREAEEKWDAFLCKVSKDAQKDPANKEYVLERHVQVGRLSEALIPNKEISLVMHTSIHSARTL
jgi:hypothetical protein